MENWKGVKMQRVKTIVLVIIPLLISMVIITSAIYLNSIPQFFLPETLQNIAYIAMLLNTILFIKVSKKSLRDIGLFPFRLLRQFAVGGVIGAIFLVGGILTGWRISLMENSLYFIISQILVALSEELLFRGYILTMLKDVVKTPDRAVFISALIFGLWHYPISHNIGLVLITAFTGAVYGSLRTIFEKTEDEISIISLTASHWLFNIVL